MHVFNTFVKCQVYLAAASVRGADRAVTRARLGAEYSAGDRDFWLWLPQSDAE